MKPAPPVDPRTTREIIGQLQLLLSQYLGTPRDPRQAASPQLAPGVSTALYSIFARFTEVIIQRLNQMPDKNFLAFLNLLGTSRLPPQPAQVPITFFLAAGSLQDGNVPAGTQVSAPPPDGQSDPVIFETERALAVTTAQLTTLGVRDPEQDTYGRYDAAPKTTVAQGISMFRGERPIEHSLYISQDELLAFPEIVSLSLTLNVSKVLGDNAQAVWQQWDGSRWIDLVLSGNANATAGLGQAGENTLSFNAVKPVPVSRINSFSSRWLRCRLITPVTRSANALQGLVRGSQLPEVRDISIRAGTLRSELMIADAMHGQLVLDLSQDFFPFGETPKFGETLYLSNREAFSLRGADVTLAIKIANPILASVASPVARTAPSSDLRLQWEFWNGQVWDELGTSTPTGVTQPTGSHRFQDTTKALSDRNSNASPGEVQFRVPDTIQSTTVNGVENFWIRVRIVAGNYGVDDIYEQAADGTVTFRPATFAPPVISTIAVDYELTKTLKPDTVLTFNDATYSQNLASQLGQTGQTLTPFAPTQVDQPTFQLGFQLPTGRTTFGNRPISLYYQLAELTYGERLIPLSPESSTKSRDGASEATPNLVEHEFLITNNGEEAVNWRVDILGTQWTTRLVTPQTVLLQGKTNQTVRLQVTIPADASLGSQDQGFIKVSRVDKPDQSYRATFRTVALDQPVVPIPPRLVWEYTNGDQWQPLIVRDETNAFTRNGLVEFLPPRDFQPQSDFGLTARYWVRARWQSGDYLIEPRWQRVLLNTTLASQTTTITNELLGSSDGSENQTFRIVQTPVLTGQQLDILEPELFDSNQPGTTVVLDSPQGERTGRWLRWQEVADFYGSGPRDRHYTLNHITGEIRFGNGRQGLIPPVGDANIRLTRYRTGGGTIGNQPRNVITQLQTTLPFVREAINPLPATGGSAAEKLELVKTRKPQHLRHRFRAVTLEDYEDLAKEASTAVARAHTVPLYNLRVNDIITVDTPTRPGTLSLVIIPQAETPNPSPSLRLINQIQDYLDQRRLPNVELIVVGPHYVPVSIEADIALTDPSQASTVEGLVFKRLAQFLHPLTGGLEKTGWEFGRQPHKSDIYTLLEAIPGVDHIRTLKVPTIQNAGNFFLVFSGDHQIRLTL